MQERENKRKNHETDKPEIKIEHPVANLSVSKKQRSQTTIKYKSILSSGEIPPEKSLLGI